MKQCVQIKEDFYDMNTVIVENNYFLFILYILYGMSGDNLILQNFNQATITLFTFI